MSAPRSVLLIATLVLGCASEAPGPHETTTDEPMLREHEARFGRRLWVGPRPDVVEGTDAIPPRMFVLEERGRRRPQPIEAIDGWLTAHGALFVTVESELVDADGAVLSDVVEPDLCVSPEGDRVAFARHDEDDGGLTTVYVLSLDDGSSSPVSSSLDDALMPFFLSDGHLLVTGAHRGEILGLFHIDVDTGDARRLTNEGIMVGRGPDPRFIPVPIRARDIHEVPGSRVTYFDGDAEQTVSWLPPLTAPTGALDGAMGEVAP